jgi:putative membrane protein
MAMTSLAKRFLTAAERQQVEGCIRSAELRTRSEIVVLVASASHAYPMATLLGAVALAFAPAVALTPLAGRLLWLGPHNMWAFLGLFLAFLGVFYPGVQRLPALKRLFVTAHEMEAEVQEAAAMQFFHKGLYRTRDATGVLIYISVFERKVWVLGDRGIDAKIGPGFWGETVAGIVAGIKAGRPAAAICESITRIAPHLGEKFPAGPDNPDELQNLIID